MATATQKGLEDDEAVDKEPDWLTKGGGPVAPGTEQQAEPMHAVYKWKRPFPPVLPEVDRRRGKLMLRPWSSGALCSWLFALPVVSCSTKKRRNYLSSNQRILHGIGSIKTAHMAMTGDHYRTLEAIKPLEPVINDSSQGPADLAQ
ncbi:hypothetical protein GBF38_003813 [Nibea albiflora]|uniref:Uncharacterized protein n=1 Tax=Nibea albiflora TaxID=240163 RepID=A0ACB7F0R1_NIBAL|nr:hypothetical protein GBF38_003813 [Nibea albiflora]